MLIGFFGAYPTSASITNTRADAWGTLELSGSSWLGGHGVNVYSNGSSAGYDSGTYNYVTVNGKSVMSGEEWQCVEMVNRLYLTRGWITSTWPGDGYQLYDNAPSNLTKEPNGSITYLNPGDVIVFSGYTYGHVAVVNSVSGSTVSIVNQNTVAVYSSATFSNGTLTMSGWAGYSVTGVVHAPINSNGTSGPSGQLTPNPAAYVDSVGTTHVYVTTNGGLNHYWKLAGATGWSSEIIDYSSTFSAPAAFSTPSAEHVFVMTGTGVNHYANYADGTGWHGEVVNQSSAWEFSPTAVVDPSGNLHVFGVYTGGLAHLYKTPTGGWQYELVAAGSFSSAPTAVVDRSGTIHVFVDASAGGVYHYANSGYGWGSEEVTTNTMTSDVTAFQDSSGGLHVVGTTSGGINPDLA